MVSKLISNLKTFFNSIIYYKSDDESNFHNFVDDTVSYSNGVFKTNYNGSQFIDIGFIGEYDSKYNRYVGNFQGYVSPSTSNQVITISTNQAEHTANINDDGFFQVTGNPALLWYNSNTEKQYVNIHVNSVTVNGQLYKGIDAVYYFEEGVVEIK